MDLGNGSNYPVRKFEPVGSPRSAAFAGRPNRVHYFNVVIDAASPDFHAYYPSKNRNSQFHYDVTIASEEAINPSSVLKKWIAVVT
jgi:hypothetical protein